MRSMKQMCQTVQFLTRADENVVSVFGSCEPFAQCCATFFELGDLRGINTTLGREVGQLGTRRRQSPRRLLL